jgi:hypothetical protein
MTVKLAILKSGENIITDIKEGFYEEKLVCYVLENPCNITVNGKYSINGDNQYSISLNRWPVLSKDSTIEIIPEWIVTLVDPIDKLKELYESQSLEIEDKNEQRQTDSINE